MHVCKLHHDVAWALAGAPVPRPGAHGSVCTPPRRSACRAAPPEQPQQQPPAASPAAPAATGGKGGMALNEDMLAQLRSAQEEAARLKRELEVLQQQRGGAAAGGEGGAAGSSGADGGAAGSRVRIDSTDSRELPWGPGKRTAWLSEADVDFFTGRGATEGASIAAAAAAGGASPDGAGGAASSSLSPEAQATVGRRLALGAVAATGLGAFALVPTSELALLKPRQPMFFYIASLLQAQAQLGECRALIDNAQWEDLRRVLPRIKGPPINAESALASVVSLLDAPTASRAQPLASEFLEYLALMDYNQYYDAMPTATLSGAQAAEFVSFSGRALKSAQQRLAAFLALLPADQLEAAATQAAAQQQAMATPAE